MRVVLLGNAGSGKSTMARRLIGDRAIPRLSLDEIAWEDGAVRRPLSESLALLDDFLAKNDDWVVEGCYAELVEHALDDADELRFLNPGSEACVANCRRRPWEPEKFPTPEAQAGMLETLIEWVRDYEARDDEYGLAAHRRLFDEFDGAKREYKSLDDYDR